MEISASLLPVLLTAASVYKVLRDSDPLIFNYCQNDFLKVLGIYIYILFLWLNQNWWKTYFGCHHWPDFLRVCPGVLGASKKRQNSTFNHQNLTCRSSKAGSSFMNLMGNLRR